MKYVRSYTFAALDGDAVAVQNGLGDMADPDAIVQATATVAAATELSGEDLDGVIGEASVAPWRGLSVTSSTQAATFNTTDPIVATVELDHGGRTVTRTISATLTAAGGNETVYFDGPFQRVVSIAIPAMLTTDGTLAFGVADVFSKHGPGVETFESILGLASGNLKVGYPDGSVDIIPTADGRVHEINPSKIFRVGTTALFSVNYRGGA